MELRHVTIAAALLLVSAGVNTPDAAQAAATPWVFAPDMAYGYGADNAMTSYKLGTNNAKFLFKGAKKVPRNTLFFVGENGQLYMRTGPYLENGKFSFGPG